MEKQNKNRLIEIEMKDVLTEGEDERMSEKGKGNTVSNVTVLHK